MIFFGLQALNQKLIQAVIPGIFSWYSDHLPCQESVTEIKTGPFAKKAAGAASTSVLSIKSLDERDKVMP